MKTDSGLYKFRIEELVPFQFMSMDWNGIVHTLQEVEIKRQEKEFTELQMDPFYILPRFSEAEVIIVG